MTVSYNCSPSRPGGNRIVALLAAPGLAIGLLVSAGCGHKSTTPNSPTTTTTSSATASGCTASGLDAMETLSKFQLEMDAAQKAGKITLDQLIAARDKLFNQTQDAAKKEDWATYCKAINDMRAELRL